MDIESIKNFVKRKHPKYKEGSAMFKRKCALYGREVFLYKENFTEYKKNSTNYILCRLYPTKINNKSLTVIFD
jgi:hypothetical protein